MNKPLSTQETAALLAGIPKPYVEMKTPIMLTRAEKMHHWARLIRASVRDYSSYMYSNLEKMPAAQWDSLDHPGTIFALAATDPVLREAGLKSMSVGDAVRFFELTRDELHAFACDCEGAISNGEMANRIDAIADGKKIERRYPHAHLTVYGISPGALGLSATESRQRMTPLEVIRHFVAGR